MILSMTGYGKGEYTYAGKTMTVEIRSVNSKQLDLTIKAPASLRERETAIRALMQRCERGKVDVLINTGARSQETCTDAQTGATAGGERLIDTALLARYMQDYLFIAGAPRNAEGGVPAEVMATLLRMPDVVRNDAGEEPVSDEEWEQVRSAIDQALTQFNAFRTQEGAALQAMFEDKLTGIARLLEQVEPYEATRVEKIRQRLLLNLDKLQETSAAHGEKVVIDRNRLEQEMIYYLEKLDVTEEKVRLRNHLRYFRETMEQGGSGAEGQQGVGKKLGFIAQEMGREINTHGSKSNQSEMQILVVKMKDLLEQIKEQVLNVM